MSKLTALRGNLDGLGFGSERRLAAWPGLQFPRPAAEVATAANSNESVSDRDSPAAAPLSKAAGGGDATELFGFRRGMGFINKLASKFKDFNRSGTTFVGRILANRKLADVDGIFASLGSNLIPSFPIDYSLPRPNDEQPMEGKI